MSLIRKGKKQHTVLSACESAGLQYRRSSLTSGSDYWLLTSEGRSFCFDCRRQSATAFNRGFFNLLFILFSGGRYLQINITFSQVTTWRYMGANQSSVLWARFGFCWHIAASVLSGLLAFSLVLLTRVTNLSSAAAAAAAAGALLKRSKMPMVLRSRKTTGDSSEEESTAETTSVKPRRSTRLRLRVTYEVGIFITHSFRLLFLHSGLSATYPRRYSQRQRRWIFKPNKHRILIRSSMEVFYVCSWNKLRIVKSLFNRLALL